MAITISSSFDAGNIKVVSQDGDRADLEIVKDHLSDFYQWFYFRVAGAAGREITLRITNCGGSAYPHGWPDYKGVMSLDREEWVRISDTKYADGVLTMTLTPPQDVVWIAYFAPYSMERHHDLVTSLAGLPGVAYSSLGKSLDGQDIDCLTIGEGPLSVWLYARQHPGESMAEWWMEGALEKLTDEDDPVARLLRRECTFHVVPNMNPDGSRRGHLRTNAAGIKNALVGPAEVPVKDPERVRTLGPGYIEEGPIATTVIANWTDGEFVIDQAAPGVMRLWGLAEGHAWTSTEPFELHAGERRDGVVLVLQPLATEDRIGGRVLDPEGKPVSQARVDAAFEWTEGSTSLSEETRPDGSFSFVVQARVPHELRIADPTDRWSPLVFSPVQPGQNDLVARFEEPRWIELSVRARGGEAVTKYGAELVQAEFFTRGMDMGALSMVRPDEAHPGGLARLRLPNTPFRIRVDAPGHDLAQLGPYDPRSPPARIEVELEKLPGACGRVSLASPAEGLVEVELLRAHSNTWKNGYRVLYGGWPNATARPEADGSFCLDLRESGRYWIRAYVRQGRRAHHTLAELGPFELDARRGASGLELTGGAGGTIEGVVLVPKGENAAGRIVAFNHCDGEPFTLRSDAEGRFRAEHLAPGRWQVLGAPEELTGTRTSWGSTAELEPPSEDSLWTSSVREGETTHVELDLRQEHSGTLEGHIDCAGASCAGWTVALRETGALRSDGGATLSSTLAAEGRFHFEFPRGGSYALEFTAPGEPGRTLALQTHMKLDSGANNWERRVELTSLAGTGLPPESPEGVVFEYRAQGELEARCRIVPDAQGRFALPLVLAGKGEIARYQSAPGPNWTSLANFEALAGQAASVKLP